MFWSSCDSLCLAHWFGVQRVHSTGTRKLASACLPAWISWQSIEWEGQHPQNGSGLLTHGNQSQEAGMQAHRNPGCEALSLGQPGRLAWRKWLSGRHQAVFGEQPDARLWDLQGLDGGESNKLATLGFCQPLQWPKRLLHRCRQRSTVQLRWLPRRDFDGSRPCIRSGVVSPTLWPEPGGFAKGQRPSDWVWPTHPVAGSQGYV